MSKSLVAKRRPGVRVFKFFKDVQTELSRVTFPTREEGIRLTSVVMVVTLVAAASLYVLDLFFSYVITWLITL